MTKASKPTGKAFSTMLLLAAGVAAIPAVGALLLGLSPTLQLLSTRTVQAAAFVHFGIIAWLVALLLVGFAALRVRRTWVAALGLPLAAGLVWQLSWIAPFYRSDQVAHRTPLSVAVINLDWGRGDLDQLIRKIDDADTVVLIEIDHETRAELRLRGFARAYPHQVHKGTGAAGTSIYSRLPLDNLGSGGTTFGSPLARIHHDTGPILLMGVHPVNPMGGRDPWFTDARSLREHIRPHVGEPLVVAGDFNAIDRHATLRPLLEEDGLSSTARITGAGLPRTWPTAGPGSRFGPLIGIDHVLVSPSMTAVSHRQFEIDNTDHAGLWVEVAKRA
ncbi:MAG TPA: hypothetical protein GXZ30_02355 [Propionibacterium sp.]|nr:hypothetical protein [Propionibacterium sp.]